MNSNLHNIDRIVRGIVGVFAIGLALLNDHFLQEPILEILIGLFGVLNLISFATGWCPVYQLARISTRPMKK